MKTIQLLKASRELITDSKNWCIGSLENSAGQHCAVGAILKSASVNIRSTIAPWSSVMKHQVVRDAILALSNAIPQDFMSSSGAGYEIMPDPEGVKAWDRVAVYNNTTGHTRILEIFDLAIARQLIIDSMANAEPGEMPARAQTSAELVGV